MPAVDPDHTPSRGDEPVLAGFLVTAPHQIDRPSLGFIIDAADVLADHAQPDQLDAYQ
ncbi:hypothetical protein D3C72_2105110 [compost metagenome]